MNRSAISILFVLMVGGFNATIEKARSNDLIQGISNKIDFAVVNLQYWHRGGN